MTKNLTDRKIECPNCGHHIHVTLDTTKGDQNYYEACPACCMDIHLNMHINQIEDSVELDVDADDEQVF